MGKKKKDSVDKYRVSKCPLQQILLEDTDFSPVASAIDRTNEIVTFSYMFLRLYILHQIEHNKIIPIITRTSIKMAFKVISKKSNGPKPKGDNLDIYNKFQAFYDSKFSKIVKNTLFDSSNLSSILDYSATEMLTNIENNIWMHFTSRVKLFVNQMFKQYIKTTLDKYTGKEKKTKSQELNSEITKVKKALLENTYNCDKKYHKWLNKYRSKILPQTFNKSYAYDVKCNPQKYLPYMIRMSSILEEKGLKQFQFFPLRTEITSKNITLDTKAIVELLVSSNKTEYLFNISKYHNKLWSDYFNTSDKIFKQNSYSFDHKIKTDGYSVSVQLINNKCIEEEIQKRKQMVAASNKAKAEYKGKSKEDIQNIKDNKEKIKKRKQLRHVY